MSPEQIRRDAVDRRTDVWAYGAVVFEMLTGRKAFEGDGVAGTLAAVLGSEPAWESLSGVVAPRVVGVLRAVPDEGPERTSAGHRRCPPWARGSLRSAGSDAR